MKLNNIDPISKKYIEWQKVYQHKNYTDLKIAVIRYVSDTLYNMDPEKMLMLCLNKAELGALEHGPKMLEDGFSVEGEKLNEVVDIFNYITREHFEGGDK